MNERDARNMNAVLAALADQVAERTAADGTATETAADPAPAVGEDAARRRIPAWGWRAAAGLATAAAVGALLLARGVEVGDANDPLAAPPEQPVPSMASELDVEADGAFAVLPTSDPNMTVVLLLNLDESD